MRSELLDKDHKVLVDKTAVLIRDSVQLSAERSVGRALFFGLPVFRIDFCSSGGVNFGLLLLRFGRSPTPAIARSARLAGSYLRRHMLSPGNRSAGTGTRAALFRAASVSL